jgi:enamine deaminase RidA (YjgF/YER057c/UK114 family)
MTALTTTSRPAATLFTHDQITAKAKELNLILPPIEAPSARYLPWTVGQISQEQGQPAHFATLQSADHLAFGRAAAASAALALLAQLCHALKTLDKRFSRVLRLGVFVAAGAEFAEHSGVADGASELLFSVLGDAGEHARTAVGVASLPQSARKRRDWLQACCISTTLARHYQVRRLGRQCKPT